MDSRGKWSLGPDRLGEEGWRRWGKPQGWGGRSDRARRKAERGWWQASRVAGCKCARNPVYVHRTVAVPPKVSPPPTQTPLRPHPLPLRSIPPHPPPAGGLRRLSLPRSLCSSSILLPRASGGSETYNPTRPPIRTCSRALQTPPPHYPLCQVPHLPFVTLEN